MTDHPERIGQLLLEQLMQLAVVLPVALLTLWLLHRRWLAHITPGLQRSTTLVRQAGFGTAVAFGALGATVLPAAVLGDFSAVSSGWHAFSYQIVPDAFANAGGMALLFSVQSLFEEALFRGIGVALLAMLLMKVGEVLFLPAAQWRFGTAKSGGREPEGQLWRQRAWVYSGLISNAVLSIGFAMMHAHNPNVSTVGLANIALAGLWLGLLFLRRASLLAAWVAHFAWNLGLALLGLPVSGFALLKDPLGFGIDGARGGLLTGGAFGPEASLPAAVAFVALSVVLTWQLLRQRSPVAEAAVPSAAGSDSAGRQVG